MQSSKYNELIDYNEPSDYGVNLSDFNSINNYYMAPRDGYVYINSWGDNEGRIRTLNGCEIYCKPGERIYIFIKQYCRFYCVYANLNSLQFGYFPFHIHL